MGRPINPLACAKWHSPHPNFGRFEPKSLFILAQTSREFGELTPNSLFHLLLEGVEPSIAAFRSQVD